MRAEAVVRAVAEGQVSGAGAVEAEGVPIGEDGVVA
jgi:hypothetical protein